MSKTSFLLVPYFGKWCFLSPTYMLKKPKTLLRRLCSLTPITCERLLVKEYGDPLKTVHLESHLVQDITPTQIITKTLASPVNPADINTIQGVYAIKPNVPFIPGNEAVLEVVRVGRSVVDFRPGDRVIPKTNALGTWSTHVVAEASDFIKIPPSIDIVSAATVAVNPCTAYRMLHDFTDLKENDVVIQNCANSAVGQAVIQICASKRVQTINIVRKREDFEEVRSFLVSLGATMVIQDSDLRTSSELRNFPKPKLALNGVSGKTGSELLRNLAHGSSMVTYGGMSRQPLTVSIGSLIFSDVCLRGFWMTRWNNRAENQEERLKMLNSLFDLIARGLLRPPHHQLVPFEDFKTALQRAMPLEGRVGKKQILCFS